jgi:hypothetical protein
LRKDGLKVWFDEWVLKPGDSIPAKIEEGLEHSTFGFRISDFGFAQPGMCRFPQSPAVAKPLPRPRWCGRICMNYELAS